MQVKKAGTKRDGDLTKACRIAGSERKRRLNGEGWVGGVTHWHRGKIRGRYRQGGIWADGVCRYSQHSTSKESWTHTIGKATAETGRGFACSRLEDEVEESFGQWHWKLDSQRKRMQMSSCRVHKSAKLLQHGVAEEGNMKRAFIICSRIFLYSISFTCCMTLSEK